MHRRRLAPTIACVLWLAGCNAIFDVAATSTDERAYSLLYPYYAEFCAVSQIKKKAGFGADTSGGPGGHSVFYLNGVCRDRTIDFPTLVLCTSDVPLSDQGVGLSVNAHFKNANWVATSGRAFFFSGGLAPNDRLTHAAYAKVQAEAEAQGLYDGIVFHSEVFDDMPPGMKRRDYMYEVSIATDYAIAFGRDRYCARVPVSRNQLTRMVQYLNQVNSIYRDGKKDFEWDVLQNNCTHLAHNALAAAGLWDEWETDRFVLISAFDFPVPKNEFVNLVRRTNDFKVDDLEAVYDDQSARRALMEDYGLPTRPGALAEAEPLLRNNDVYDTDPQLIFYDDPIFGPYERNFRTIFSDPRYTDIRENLQYFDFLYRRIRAERPTFVHQDHTSYVHARNDLAVFSKRFYEYIDREARGVEMRLDTLNRSRLNAGDQH